jgi:sigma-B regulation protein RsbU (phosphoserine phosphatase)
MRPPSLIDADHFAVYLSMCGHGVGASLLLSPRHRHPLRSLPKTDFRDPGGAFRAEQRVPMEKQNSMYFTMWYGVYHAPSRQARHASGGHPPALLLVVGQRRSRPASNPSPGLIVGAMEDLVYASQSCPRRLRQLLVLRDGCYEISDGQAR